MNSKYDILIVGGGAAGFFTAINIVEKNPKLKVAILERGKEVLSKVAEAHPTSTVAERYGKKSTKDVKTREIVKKHVDKITKGNK
jgi:succinate dehydrogenase/fumarate reductase flavoprotein subunit